MSQSLKELIQLFNLRKINFDSANRKTLDNWVQKVKLQKRRQLLFESACDQGKKKSRVALCKAPGRPGFSKELSTMGTKKLRKVIKSFLTQIGLNNYGSLEHRSDKELQKVSADKNWERVLFMSDQNVADVEEPSEGKKDENEATDKSGAGPGSKHKKRRRHRASSVPPMLSPSVRHEPRGRSRSPRQALRLFDGRRGGRSRGPRNRPAASPPRAPSPAPAQPARPPSPAYGSPRPALPKRRSRLLRVPGVNPNLEVGPAPIPIVPNILRIQPGISAVAAPPLPRRGVPPLPVPPLPAPVVPPVLTPKKAPDKIPEPSQPKGLLPPLPLNAVRECYREKEFPDECVACSPRDLSGLKLPREAKKELNYLSIQRKLVCERTALLKCKFDELRYQRMCWDLFHENAYGDFFTRISKDKFKLFEKCTPDTAYDTNDISKMKGILGCYSNSQKICRGYHQVQAKEHQDTQKLGPDFNLPTMRYEQLENENRVDTNNVFIQTALRNRKPEEPTGYKKVCEKPPVPLLPFKTPEEQTPKMIPKNSLLEAPVMVSKPNVRPVSPVSSGLRPLAPMRGPPIAAPHPTGESFIPRHPMTSPSPQPYSPRQASPRFMGSGSPGSPGGPHVARPFFFETRRQLEPSTAVSSATSGPAELPKTRLAEAFMSAPSSGLQSSHRASQGMEDDWKKAKLLQISKERQRYPEESDLGTEIVMSFSGRIAIPTVKNTIDQFRRDHYSDEQIRDSLFSLSGGAAKNSAAITVQKIREIYPAQVGQSQGPGHFHFSGEPVIKHTPEELRSIETQQHWKRQVQSPTPSSPTGISVTLGPNLPMSDVTKTEHAHVPLDETPSQELLRAFTTQEHKVIPHPVTSPVEQQLQSLSDERQDYTRAMLEEQKKMLLKETDPSPVATGFPGVISTPVETQEIQDYAKVLQEQLDKQARAELVAPSLAQLRDTQLSELTTREWDEAISQTQPPPKNPLEIERFDPKEWPDIISKVQTPTSLLLPQSVTPKPAGGIKIPKRKSLVGSLFKRKKTPKKTKKRSKTPKKRSKTPKKRSTKHSKALKRLPKPAAGWDDDDYLANMPTKADATPVRRIIRQPSIRRKRKYL